MTDFWNSKMQNSTIPDIAVLLVVSTTHILTKFNYSLKCTKVCLSWYDLLPNRLSHPRHPHSRWPKYSTRSQYSEKFGKIVQQLWTHLSLIKWYFINQRFKSFFKGDSGIKVCLKIWPFFKYLEYCEDYNNKVIWR